MPKIRFYLNTRDVEKFYTQCTLGEVCHFRQQAVSRQAPGTFCGAIGAFGA
ncbi:MAG: hypothetical protein WD398_14300 [Cyclobacteriaceae bacterium]